MGYSPRTLRLWGIIEAPVRSSKANACSRFQCFPDSALVLGDHFLGCGNNQITVAGGFQKESRHDRLRSKSLSRTQRCGTVAMIRKKEDDETGRS
jgi:hypothetical protein